MAKHGGKCPRCGRTLAFDTAVGEHVICSGCGAKLGLAGRDQGGATPPKARPAERADPLIGQTLGPFEIVELIGRGGMGSVYKARQASLDRLVAVKVLSQELAQDAGFVARFHREGRAAAAVSHPNVIEIHDVGEDRGYHYIVMEYVAGENLADMLEHGGRLAPQRALDLMKQVADALGAAHGAKVLHRDIKPANILVRPDGVAKVADFGLAKRPEADASVTQTGHALGTPLYISPEGARGQATDARSDLYCLGATFYRVLAGRPPFDGDTTAAVLAKHMEARVPPLNKVAPDTPPALCRVIHRLLRKNPAERYQDARALKAALMRAEARLGTPPVEMAPAAATQHLSADERLALKKRQQRRNALIGAIVGAAALALLAVFLLPFLGRKAEPPEAPQAGRVPRDAVPFRKRPSPTPKKKVTQAKSRTGPKPKATAVGWKEAWKEVEQMLPGLLFDERFGDAMRACEGVTKRYNQPRLLALAQEAMEKILEQAEKAYTKAEQRARQLLEERKFAEARAALQLVIEQHGIASRKTKAQRLLALINAVEKAPLIGH